MKTRSLLLAGLPALLVFTLGGSCRFDLTPLPPGYVPLDEAEADIIIVQPANSSTAQVTALITTRSGFPLELDPDQSISVNDRALDGPDDNDEYKRNVSAANTYTIRVTEPTRGVETTTVEGPRAFNIQEPDRNDDVSLSGFTLEWSNPDPDLDVTIILTQTVLDEERSEEFGPITDDGSIEFDDDDLRRFRQGADLEILVTKTVRRSGINGLRSGRVFIEVSRSTVADPAP